jgi:hypothetical protein
MKVSSIKKLVEGYSIDDLKRAEAALLEEQLPAIQIEGDDDGEKLTHVLAGIFIHEKLQEGLEFARALREYSKKVRESIS